MILHQNFKQFKLIDSLFLGDAIPKAKINQSEGLAEFPPHPPSAKPEHRIEPRHLPEYLEGRTPKEKRPFHFQKRIPRAHIRNARNVFLRCFRRVRETVAGRSSSVRFSFASPRAERVGTTSHPSSRKKFEQSI